jgi:hypothetical protein
VKKVINEQRYQSESPFKDYMHMRVLANRLKDIFPEYEFSTKPNGYEIDIKSKNFRYKRVKMQRFKKVDVQEVNYRLAIPEKGRSYDCGLLPELKDAKLLKKALDIEIKAIDGSW